VAVKTSWRQWSERVQVTEMVRAAGGVIRGHRTEHGQVLLVHRPRYDDWTFPKGKAKKGESDEACALREVAEETGLHCALEMELPSTLYPDAKGRTKRVRWWRMRPVSGSFAPTKEVDEIRWLAPQDAQRFLTYEHDAAVLQAVG
jgi:8-oxo-dGTP diphosphatase